MRLRILYSNILSNINTKYKILKDKNAYDVMGSNNDMKWFKDYLNK